jgi:hypothetical protein
MKTLFRSLAAIFILTVAALTCSAQVAPGVVPFGQAFGYQHRVGAVFYAPGYATWQATILSGNSASGSASIIIAPNAGGIGAITLADGTSLPLTDVFNTNTPLYIMDANAETVTPTAVTIGSCPVGNIGIGDVTQCATVTATFAGTHGVSAPVVSGDAGIFEAFTDAGNQGGGLVYWAADTGTVTLNTGGLTTTTTTKIPTNFFSAGASAIVKTTITTSANWAVGISGSTAAFCTADSTLTAGTTCQANMNSPAQVGTTLGLTAVLFTMGTSNPGAGAIKARVWGWSAVQATQ